MSEWNVIYTFNVMSGIVLLSERKQLIVKVNYFCTTLLIPYRGCY